MNCCKDADSEINMAEELGPILVAADDTDIVVLLLYHWQESMNDIHVSQTRSCRTLSIRQSQADIADIKSHLLFLHSWSGCDTTSAIYGKGKGGLVKLLKQSQALRHASTVICNPLSIQDEVGDASIVAMKIL